MKTLDDIKSSMQTGADAAVSVAELDALIAAEPSNDEALLTRGMLHWRLSHRAEAINDLNAALRINPLSRAKVMLQSVYTILDFYDKDLYNP